MSKELKETYLHKFDESYVNVFKRLLAPEITAMKKLVSDFAAVVDNMKTYVDTDAVRLSELGQEGLQNLWNNIAINVDTANKQKEFLKNQLPAIEARINQLLTDKVKNDLQNYINGPNKELDKLDNQLKGICATAPDRFKIKLPAVDVQKLKEIFKGCQ